MDVQYRLTQEDVAQIVAAALSYNGKHPTDVAFDLRNGVEIIVTCEDEPLQVRDSPDSTGSVLDPMSADVLKEMRERHAANN